MGVVSSSWTWPVTPVGPTAGTSTVTSCPVLTSPIELSGTSTLTCQVPEVRSAMTGRYAPEPDPSAVSLDCGPSGSSENSGRWVADVPGAS